MGVFCFHICTCTMCCMPDIPRGQTRASYSLGLDWVILNCLVLRCLVTMVSMYFKMVHSKSGKCANIINYIDRSLNQCGKKEFLRSQVSKSKKELCKPGVTEHASNSGIWELEAEGQQAWLLLGYKVQPCISPIQKPSSKLVAEGHTKWEIVPTFRNT